MVFQNLADLFLKAQDLSRETRETRAALEESPEELLARIRDVRAKLKAQILDDFENRVIEAARDGKFALDLWTFNGNDHVDDISVLFLVRGQRPMTPPPPPGCPAPLFDELKNELRPFALAHDWDGISSGNRLVLRWTP